MRNVLTVSVFLVFLLLPGMTALAQDEPTTSVIIVKNSETNSGVITLQISKESKSYELTCNDGLPGCTVLKKGTYRMLVLPKNRGMYDCQNVRIYAESAAEDDEKLGEYCLLGK